MGLFGWGKRTPRYTRRRASSPPDGWTEAQAVVDCGESKKTLTQVGGGQEPARVYETTTTYTVLDPDDIPLPVVVEAKLRVGDMPQQGERLVIAYDPADPTDVVVLVSETEYGDRLRDYVRDAIQHGSEAPCEVLAAAPTGRVARRNEAAPEVRLDLHVAPSDGEPFRVSRSLWDRVGLTPGARGTLFYLDGEREHGYPVFPDSGQPAGGGDPVRLARDEFVELLTGGTRVVAPGLTISSGGSTPLDG